MKSDDDGMDLVTPIPQKIAESQALPSGQRYLLEADGLLAPFCFDPDLFMGKRISKRLRAEQGWFENIVVHAPSVGSFYEDALKGIMSELLPARYKIGTGFVFDADTRKTSNQIDILIYDDFDESPTYRRGDFVVISPNNVISASEVKKKLTLADVREIVRKSFTINLGGHISHNLKCNYLNVFSYSNASNSKKVFDTLASAIRREVDDFSWKTKNGTAVRFCPDSIVLPNFFFFDNRNYIECRLVAVGGTHLWDIHVTLFEASGEDGLSEFLSASIETCRKAKTDLKERNYRTIPIRSVEREEIIQSRFRFMKRHAMLDLIEIFPQEVDLLRGFRVNGKRPHSFYLPAAIDLGSFGSFKNMIASKDIGWEGNAPLPKEKDC